MASSGIHQIDDLPESIQLDIGVLGRLFADTTTSYKLFFFLALLNRIERSESDIRLALDRPIRIAELAVDMVLAAWYPHAFCRLSLGAVDMLQDVVDGIEWGQIRGTWIKSGGAEFIQLRARCAAALNTDILLRYVPYRILRPFFSNETRGIPDHRVNDQIVQLSERLFSIRKPFYCFTQDRSGIILHHDWMEYLQRNMVILKGWTHFHLARYLQSRNPAVPGILEKLEAPATRASLSKQTEWWEQALPHLGNRARCIYTGSPLSAEDISLDHYLPWSFIAHDRLWNLIPVSKKVNSAKSDHLPDTKYLLGLVKIQHAAISVMKNRWPDERWTSAVEPWIIDIGVSKSLILDFPILRKAYFETIHHLEFLASRQGFPTGWKASVGT